MGRIGWVATMAVLLSAGCASSPSSSKLTQTNDTGTSPVASKQKIAVYDKSRKGESNLHCTRFQPTGSHRIITRCVSQEQRQLEEDAARNALIKATGPVLTAPADL